MCSANNALKLENGVAYKQDVELHVCWLQVQMQVYEKVIMLFFDDSSQVLLLD